jgi:hypothetical protein
MKWRANHTFPLREREREREREWQNNSYSYIALSLKSQGSKLINSISKPEWGQISIWKSQWQQPHNLDMSINKSMPKCSFINDHHSGMEWMVVVE